MLERSFQKIPFPSTICSSCLIICRITWQFMAFPHKYLSSQDTPVWTGSQGCCRGGRRDQPLPGIPGRAGLAAPPDTGASWALSQKLCSTGGCSSHSHAVGSPGAGATGVSFSRYVPSLPSVKPVPPVWDRSSFPLQILVLHWLSSAGSNTFSYKFSKSAIMRFRNLIYWLP